MFFNTLFMEYASLFFFFFLKLLQNFHLFLLPISVDFVFWFALRNFSSLLVNIFKNFFERLITLLLFL